LKKLVFFESCLFLMGAAGTTGGGGNKGLETMGRGISRWLPSEILQDFWLGPNHWRGDYGWFEDFYSPQRVVCCCTHECNYPPHVRKQIIQFKINVDDLPSADLNPYFIKAAEFIHQCRADKQRLYVHCRQGVSRSASITTAYFMLTKNICFDDALRFVEQCRNVVCPNEGFTKQLRKLDEDRPRIYFKLKAKYGKPFIKLKNQDLAQMRIILLRATGYKLVREPTPELQEVQKKREMTAWEMLEEAKKRRTAQLQSMQENQEGKQIDIGEEAELEATKPEFNIHMQLFGFDNPAESAEHQRQKREEANRIVLRDSMLSVVEHNLKEETEEVKARRAREQGDDSDVEDLSEDEEIDLSELRLSKNYKSLKRLIASPRPSEEKNNTESSSLGLSKAEKAALKRDWAFASALQMSHLRKLSSTPWASNNKPQLVDEDGLGTKRFPEHRIFAHNTTEPVRLRSPGGDRCEVCWEKWRHGDVATRLKCGHVYHWNCLHRWIGENPRCPECLKFAEPWDPPKQSEVVL